MHIPTSQLHVRPFYTTVNIFSIFYRYLLVPLARSKTCSASVHGYVYNYTSILSTKRTAKTCRHKNVMGGGEGGRGDQDTWTCELNCTENAPCTPASSSPVTKSPRDSICSHFHFSYFFFPVPFLKAQTDRHGRTWAFSQFVATTATEHS